MPDLSTIPVQIPPLGEEYGVRLYYCRNHRRCEGCGGSGSRREEVNSSDGGIFALAHHLCLQCMGSGSHVEYEERYARPGGHSDIIRDRNGYVISATHTHYSNTSAAQLPADSYGEPVSDIAKSISGKEGEVENPTQAPARRYR